LRRPHHRRHTGDLLGDGGNFGDTEVENLDALALAPRPLHDEDVLRVHVAVNDAPQVRGGQRRADLIGDVDDALERQRTGAGQDLPQRFALEVFHHQIS